eukprot:14751-Heterococcus_DN1.PRE.1
MQAVVAVQVHYPAAESAAQYCQHGTCATALAGTLHYCAYMQCLHDAASHSCYSVDNIVLDALNKADQLCGHKVRDSVQWHLWYYIVVVDTPVMYGCTYVCMCNEESQYCTVLA